METLTDQIRGERIVYPATQHDKGWNNAIDYILDTYGEGIDAVPALVEACEAAYIFLQSAPLIELQAVEDALGQNAPLAELRDALVAAGVSL